MTGAPKTPVEGVAPNALNDETTVRDGGDDASGVDDERADAVVPAADAAGRAGTGGL